VCVCVCVCVVYEGVEVVKLLLRLEADWWSGD